MNRDTQIKEIEQQLLELTKDSPNVNSKVRQLIAIRELTQKTAKIMSELKGEDDLRHKMIELLEEYKNEVTHIKLSSFPKGGGSHP